MYFNLEKWIKAHLTTGWSRIAEAMDVRIAICSTLALKALHAIF
jgi:hypothetical protein